MLPSPPRPTLADRLARIRARAGGRPVAPAGAPVRPRRIPRRERERRRERLLRLAIIGSGLFVLLILAGGALNQYVLEPRQTLASVGDTDIRRRDYWRARTAGLIEEANQFEQFASGFAPPEQRQQYSELARQRLTEANTVWGSTEVDDSTLQQMIDDQVFVQRMDQLGLSLSPEEVETALLQQFAPPGSLTTPTPPATLIPARAESATATALAAVPSEATPASSPVAIAATPLSAVAVPTIAVLPIPLPPILGGATPIATVASAVVPSTPVFQVATPVAALTASPVASPAATPAPPATPTVDEARATAEAGFTRFQEVVFPVAHMDRGDYERLVVGPALARDKVAAALAAEVGQSADQVHAAHILVGTRELADDLARRLAEGADFAQLARENSIDEGTAANGGDLGWFAPEEMVRPFAEAAFALTPGTTSEPVASDFGWHIIRQLEREPNRPLTDQQISTIEQARLTRWLEEQRATLSIESSIEPSPTPDGATFEPPIEAPPPPTPTPEPPASPVATPLSPAASGETPGQIASPAASG